MSTTLDSGIGGDEGVGNNNKNNTQVQTLTDDAKSMTVRDIINSNKSITHEQLDDTLKVVQSEMIEAGKKLESLLDEGSDDTKKAANNKTSINTWCKTTTGKYTEWSYLINCEIECMKKMVAEMADGEEKKNLVKLLAQQNELHENVTKYIMELLKRAKYIDYHTVESLQDKVTLLEGELANFMSTKILNEDSYTEEWMPKSPDLHAKFEKDVKEWNVTLAELLLLLTCIYENIAKLEADEDENTPKEEEERDESAALYQLRMAIIAMDNKRLEIVGFASRISDELRDGLKLDPNLEEKVVEIKKQISMADYYNLWQHLHINGIAIPTSFGKPHKREAENFICMCEKVLGETPSAKIKDVSKHKIAKHFIRRFKPGEDGGDGEYVSPYSNDQIKYNGAEGDMTVAEAKKIVEVARGYVFTAMGVDKVYFVRKSTNHHPWWYNELPPRAKVLVSAIETWRRCIEQTSNSEGTKIKARHAIKELVKAGMCEESNKEIYDRFLDEINSDQNNVKTKSWYATVMLLALEVKESKIPQDKRCFNNSDEFFIAADNMHKSLGKEYHGVLNFNVLMQETWFEKINTPERRELLNRVLLATASSSCIASMQLMNILVEAGAVCPCYACEGKEHVISALRDWEHPDDKARELKSTIKNKPSKYTVEQLLQHFEKDKETGMYKIRLLLPCAWAHRQKDQCGLSRKAAGEQVDQKIGIKRQMNKRLFNQLDEKKYPKTIMFDRPKISSNQSAGVDRHHVTEDRYGCVCDGQLFEILKKIKDVAKLEAEIEKHIGKEITKHDTAKNDDISQMILYCTDITLLMTDVLAEYYKTRPAMCMDHRIMTRVMQKEDCMRIFGLINPCIVTEKYIVINREWIKKMENDEFDKSMFVRKNTDEEIKTNVEELERKLNVSNPWEEIELDIEKLVHQMNRMSPSIYKTELTKLRKMEN